MQVFANAALWNEDRPKTLPRWRPPVRVRFAEDESEALTALELTLPMERPEATEQPELLGLYAALRSEGVQVSHIELRKGVGSTSVKLRLADVNGGKVSAQRRAQAQAAVLEVISQSATLNNRHASQM